MIFEPNRTLVCSSAWIRKPTTLGCAPTFEVRTVALGMDPVRGPLWLVNLPSPNLPPPAIRPYERLMKTIVCS